MSTKLRASARMTFIVVATALSAGAQEPTGGWEAPAEAQPVLILRASAAGAERTGTNLLTGSFPLTREGYTGLVLTPAFEGGEDLCSSSVTFSLNPDDLAHAAAAWHVEGRLVDLRQGEATIDLRWTRQVNRADLVPTDRLTWKQRLRVREGDRGVIDLVRRTSQSGHGCDSFAITYEVQFEGPRALSGAAIGYDIWLVQRDADGELVTDHYRATARQGEQADYFFRPIAYATDGRRGAADAPLQLSVSGAVRGRARTDGRIDLTVDGEVLVFNREQSMSTSGRGRSLLTVRAGETVEVEAVRPAGRLGKVGDVRQIFANHRTGVRITARRLW